MAANAQRAGFARRTRQWCPTRQWFLIAGGVCTFGVSTLVAGGCALLEAPALEPTPVPPPTPLPDVFDPADFIVPLPPDPAATKLNKVGDPVLPDAFRVVRVLSGELVSIQSVDTPPAPAAAPLARGAAPAPPPVPARTPTPIYGAPEVVRLAGILAPAPGQPGGAEAMRTIQGWTLGQTVSVEQDSRYPTDFDQRRRVQIFFMGRMDNPATPEVDEGKVPTSYLLNRMMVRSGRAVVDIYSPTSFDTKGWLNDEEYARQRRLGLWGQGIILGRRPLPTPVPRARKVLKQNVTIIRDRNATPSKRRISPRASTGAGVTQKQYERINLGMSYAEVVRIIGRPGTLASGAAEPGVTQYEWNVPGSWFSAWFRN
ncbi:MAG TPA: thermonuclease family protein, partial [Abditibacteriaceae bacterium]|nr:thermonuclease family protein [Abditibacteriaceae bacterium]